MIFFFISKNDIYTKVYSMHEEHRANPEVQEEENREKNTIENQTTK